MLTKLQFTPLLQKGKYTHIKLLCISYKRDVLFIELPFLQLMFVSGKTAKHVKAVRKYVNEIATNKIEN